MNCYKCKKRVSKKDHYVKISTLNRPNKKPDDHVFFHFSCWKDFFNESVTNKARKEVEAMRTIAVKLMDHPMLRNILSSFGGDQILQQMLGTPLVKPEIVTIVNKKEIAKQIDNDRKKREKGKTRSRSK